MNEIFFVENKHTMLESEFQNENLVNDSSLYNNDIKSTESIDSFTREVILDSNEIQNPKSYTYDIETKTDSVPYDNDTNESKLKLLTAVSIESNTEVSLDHETIDEMIRFMKHMWYENTKDTKLDELNKMYVEIKLREKEKQRFNDIPAMREETKKFVEEIKKEFSNRKETRKTYVSEFVAGNEIYPHTEAQSILRELNEHNPWNESDLAKECRNIKILVLHKKLRNYIVSVENEEKEIKDIKSKLRTDQSDEALLREYVTKLIELKKTMYINDQINYSMNNPDYFETEAPQTMYDTDLETLINLQIELHNKTAGENTGSSNSNGELMAQFDILFETYLEHEWINKMNEIKRTPN
jgi:hypothetical protein